jgi:outer membrane protein TolC
VSVAALCTLVGCTRSYYRRSADREAQKLISEKARDPRWALQNTGVDPGPESRMFDMNDIDHPPMPEDDPASHELMRRVDGKRGAWKWRRPGEPGQESDEWLNSLPRDDSGQVRLDLENVVQVGLLNSRTFQQEREDLYLSALDVSVERFDFDPQFGLGNATSYVANGQLRQNANTPAGRLSVLTDGSVRWLSATGGQLVANFANTLLWDFNGSKVHTAGSLLDFSLVQPLMRLGGRAVTLERLTASERRLLANVRQMEQYQHGYYIRVTTGRSAGEGPARTGEVGGNGLGLIAGTPSGSVGAPRADGLLGLLEEQQRIRNLESNIARLRESLDQIEAAFDAGRINSRLQVDQARQSLANSQSSLLSTRAAYQTRLDTYKIELGLPPSLPVVVKDPLLDRLALSDPAATTLSQELSDVLEVIRDREVIKTPEDVSRQMRELLQLEDDFVRIAGKVRDDIGRARENLPNRQQQLTYLGGRPELQNLSIERHRFDPAKLGVKLAQLEGRNGQLVQEVNATFAALREHEKALPTLDLESGRAELSQLAARLSGLLLAMSLDQTATRLETLSLPPVHIESEEAVDIARDHRLDWMNARARLVDSWRQIDRSSNALLSSLDFVATGGMGTLGNRSGRFDGRTGNLRFGLRFDTPLDRLIERNDYRETLIDYQRARRDYDEFEDRVSQSLRNTLRIVELSQLNFELRRSAVQTAISQVDLARLRLDEPPRPGAQTQFGATTARDLVSALSDLLNAQNDLLGLWVGYDVLRVLLDFEMGTMALSADGRWIDPGPMTSETIHKRLVKWETRVEGNPKQNALARYSRK